MRQQQCLQDEIVSLKTQLHGGRQSDGDVGQLVSKSLKNNMQLGVTSG